MLILFVFLFVLGKTATAVLDLLFRTLHMFSDIPLAGAFAPLCANISVFVPLVSLPLQAFARCAKDARRLGRS